MGLIVLGKAPAGIGKREKVRSSIDLMFVDTVVKYILEISSIPYQGLVGVYFIFCHL